MTLILNEDQANMVVKNFTPEAKQLYVKKISHQQINVQSLLESGHLPMLSKSIELARLVNNFIQSLTTKR